MKQDPNDIEMGVKHIAVVFVAALGLGAFVIGTYALIWADWYILRVCATVVATVVFLLVLFLFAGGRK